MISATRHGFGAEGPETVTGPVLVIRDAHNHPLVLVVEISSGIQQIFSVAVNENEFREAIKKYGISLDAEVANRRL